MTYRLALFGHPVKHSLSPKIHQGFAHQFGLDIDYRLIDITGDELQHRVQQFFARGGHGANITVPHKQAVMTVTDQLTERAQQAGAVNTLFIKDQQLQGDNTDGDGLVHDFKQKHIQTSNRRILILGAGGAVKGILPALLATKPEHIHIYNRTIEKARQLAARSANCDVLSKDDTTHAFDVLINGTSLGHHGQSPPLHPKWIKPHTIVYDLSYGEAAQPFLKKAKQLGVTKTFAGLGMLHHQAALAFERWFNRVPKISLPTDNRSE